MTKKEIELELGFELHGAVTLLNEFTRLHLARRADPTDYEHANFDRLKSLQRIQRATETYQHVLKLYLENVTS